MLRFLVLQPSLCGWQLEYSKERKLHILDRLAWSELFETFLATKFSAAKRFGLEGCETLIPGMKAVIDSSAEAGVESICLGMPHRGECSSRHFIWGVLGSSCQ